MVRVKTEVGLLLEDFTYMHLPADLARVSEPFCDIAENLSATYPHDMKLVIALNDLMKAKDSAVRLQVAQRRLADIPVGTNKELK